MKTIKIAHLYYDLMNLYGENGNVQFLKHRLEEQGCHVEIHFLTINDHIDFNAYDFFYSGTGSEENEKLILEDLQKYQKDIKNAIEAGKFFLITGNSLNLFGKEIILLNNNTIPCLNIFNYTSEELDFRIIGEQTYRCNLIDKQIIGFENRLYNIKNLEANLFDNTKEKKKEGFHYKNFYGTFLLGPLLVRNPYLCDYIIKNMCKEKNIEYQKPNYQANCYLAYNEYLKNFY